jgi:transcriptional regulator with PAS, ATPase and Fis domain
MSPAMQAKLLRVLQYKEFTPLGSKTAQNTDARIIAATNVALDDRVAASAFREDLFYRLQVVKIHLPPLRERPEDLRDLVQALLARINHDLRSGITHIEEAVLDCLHDYGWPGNVRELENALLKAAALSAGNTLTVDLLPPEVQANCTRRGDSQARPLRNRLASLAEMEREHVERVLHATAWHRGEACEILGVSRPRLRRMMREYGLTPPAGVPDESDN